MFSSETNLESHITEYASLYEDDRGQGNDDDNE